MLRPARASNRSGRSYAFVCLTPIKPGSETALAEHLRSLNGASPLRWLPHVHFGRWLIIDGPKGWWPGSPRRARLRSQYLLFTASVTAPNERYADDLPGSFLQELFETIPDDADAIWGHCLGYPTGGSSQARGTYLATSQLDTLLFYVGYPDTTVGEVRDALELREHLLEFARAQDPADAAAFKHAYLEESAKWLPSN